MRRAVPDLRTRTAFYTRNPAAFPTCAAARTAGDYSSYQHDNVQQSRLAPVTPTVAGTSMPRRLLEIDRRAKTNLV